MLDLWKAPACFGKRPANRMSVLEDGTLVEVEQDYIGQTWQYGDYDEDWCSDDLVAAVEPGWAEADWWSTWDDAWSYAAGSEWTEDTWSVVPATSPEKAAPSASQNVSAKPTASTCGAPVSAVTLEATSKAKAKATSKAPAPKASGLVIAALTLGSMFSGTQSCSMSSTWESLNHFMFDGSVAFDDFGRSPLPYPTLGVCLLCDLPPQGVGGYASLFHPTSMAGWALITWIPMDQAL